VLRLTPRRYRFLRSICRGPSLVRYHDVCAASPLPLLVHRRVDALARLLFRTAVRPEKRLELWLFAANLLRNAEGTGPAATAVLPLRPNSRLGSWFRQSGADSVIARDPIRRSEEPKPRQTGGRLAPKLGSSGIPYRRARHPASERPADEHPRPTLVGEGFVSARHAAPTRLGTTKMVPDHGRHPDSCCARDLSARMPGANNRVALMVPVPGAHTLSVTHNDRFRSPTISPSTPPPPRRRGVSVPPDLPLRLSSPMTRAFAVTDVRATGNAAKWHNPSEKEIRGRDRRAWPCAALWPGKNAYWY